MFSIFLEFFGLSFFSYLMGSISDIFNVPDQFGDIMDEKYELLDTWLSKVEKSNKPYHLKPSLFNSTRRTIELAFLYDFNLLIEEFDFYMEITPKMQTELIQNISLFAEFEKSFSHFFEDCERGFINECIINLKIRITAPGKTVLAEKSHATEIFFIKSGMVEVLNNENDEMEVGKPVLYLPQYSYFGDFNIIHGLKSNLNYNTRIERDEKGYPKQD